MGEETMNESSPYGPPPEETEGEKKRGKTFSLPRGEAKRQLAGLPLVSRGKSFQKGRGERKIARTAETLPHRILLKHNSAPLLRY